MKGLFYDGVSPTEYEATITYAGSYVSVTYLKNGLRHEHSFKLLDLTSESDGDKVILTYQQATLIMSRAEWKAFAPNSSQSWKKLIKPLSASLSIMFGLFYFHDQIIDSLSALVPKSFLEVTVADMREELKKKDCVGEPQKKVLESVFMQLSRNKDEYQLYIVRSPVANAYALPGNIIVFNDALLKEITSMEAFTGILAHELAHQDKNHHQKMVVKGLLLKWVAVSLMNGIGGNILENALAGKYNQAEEIEADQEAARALAQAKIDPQGARDFFKSLEKKEDMITRFLVHSHPAYEQRVRTFAGQKIAYQKMDSADLKILQQSCLKR